MKKLILLCCVLALFSNCSRDVALIAKTDRPQLEPHLYLFADTSCIQAPNVFSPNGDGINEELYVVIRNLTTYEMLVTTQAGDTMYYAQNGFTVWDGIDSTLTDVPDSPIPYNLTISGTTTSGVELNGTATVYKVVDIFNHCISPLEAPICGDQFDPRICGIPYATNDFYCTQ
ncbi:MAG: gliding motility-associated C-terminal domain-containing protein [Flavobacteriales bacterium]